MGGWDILNRAITIISRLPIEQLITNRSDKSLDKLEQRLKDKGLLTPASRTTTQNTPPVLPLSSFEKRAETPTEQVSLGDMLTYQKKQIYGQLWLLQGHAANGSRINNKPCDCLLKHAVAVSALAEETLPMESNPLWGEIKDFADGIIPKAQVDQVVKGTYASEYPGMATRARDLRKRIGLGIPSMTLQEAKAEAARLAAEEVERSWKEAPK